MSAPRAGRAAMTYREALRKLNAAAHDAARAASREGLAMSAAEWRQLATHTDRLVDGLAAIPPKGAQ